MARKRYLSEDDWDDYLDFSDSHSEEFSDLSDSEDDVHTPYVPSDSDESSSDDLEESSSFEDEEAATVHVPSSSLSADQTIVIIQLVCALHCLNEFNYALCRCEVLFSDFSNKSM